MTIKQQIINYLGEEPKFRERRNKDRGIVNLLMKRHGALRTAVESGMMGKDTLTAIVQDYASMDRAWRQALEQNDHLRGKDYDEKDHLEARKLEELGYRTPSAVGKVEAVRTENQSMLL